MNANVKWVFFDLGSTLVNEWIAHESRFKKVSSYLNDWGKPMTTEELVKRCEHAATNFAANPYLSTLSSLNLPDDQYHFLVTNATYPKGEEQLYSGVPQMLRTLSQSFRLGIIANQPHGTKSRLKDWGILDFFSIVLASHEFGTSKPATEIFEAAQQQSGCLPEERMMVGDRIDNDIRPANAIGWKTIHVLQEFHRFQKPRQSIETPDFICSEITMVERLLLYHVSK